MSLILYPPEERAFDSNGIGILRDVMDDEVYEELNGQYELTFRYSVDGAHFADLVTDAYVTARPDPVTKPQPFRIYRITKPMAGIVTVYARHMAYRCRKIVVAPFTALDAAGAMEALKTNAVNDCPFEFWTDKDTSAPMTVDVPTDIWSLLGSNEGSVLDTYGGEYEFDGYNVCLWKHRGTDRGVTIRYGKNLTDLKMDENIANVYTGVFPYWKGDEGGLVMLPERIVAGPGNYTESKIMPLDLSQAFETAPTEEELRKAAAAYIDKNDIGKPDVSWTISFVQLEQTEEYKGTAILERVLLGDTVSVLFPKLGVDVSARAVAIRFIPSLGRYKSITLGKVKANLASTIAGQQKQITRVQQARDPQMNMDRATSWITNGRGYMVAIRGEDGAWYELCSLDTPDINQAKNVWRWNNGGFGFSSNGYQGPFKLALTQDGHFVADFITTGKLSSADGNAYFDLDGAEVGVSAPYLDDGAISKFVLRNGQLFGTVTDKDGNVESHFEILMGDGGAHINNGAGSTPLYVYAFNALLQLGRMDSPCVLRGKPLRIEGDPVTIVGSEIHIKGAPIYLGDKKLEWRTDPDAGFSYLVGVEVTT